jgi:hypothetical protein
MHFCIFILENVNTSFTFFFLKYIDMLNQLYFYLFILFFGSTAGLWTQGLTAPLLISASQVARIMCEPPEPGFSYILIKALFLNRFCWFGKINTMDQLGVLFVLLGKFFL